MNRNGEAEEVMSPLVQRLRELSSDCHVLVAPERELLDAAAARIEELERSLTDLVLRCDGEEGMRADGSNIDTRAQAAVLWPDDEEDE